MMKGGTAYSGLFGCVVGFMPPCVVPQPLWSWGSFTPFFPLSSMDAGGIVEEPFQHRFYDNCTKIRVGLRAALRKNEIERVIRLSFIPLFPMAHASSQEDTARLRTSDTINLEHLAGAQCCIQQLHSSSRCMIATRCGCWILKNMIPFNFLKLQKTTQIFGARRADLTSP